MSDSTIHIGRVSGVQANSCPKGKKVELRRIKTI